MVLCRGASPPYPHWGLRPQTPAISASFFFYLLNYLKHVFQKFGIFFEKKFFLTHEPLLMLFFKKVAVTYGRTENNLWVLLRQFYNDLLRSYATP